jgi:hypothetical protein
MELMSHDNLIASNIIVYYKINLIFFIKIKNPLKDEKLYGPFKENFEGKTYVKKGSEKINSDNGHIKVKNNQNKDTDLI